MGLALVALLVLSAVEVRWQGPEECPAPPWALPAAVEGRVEVVLSKASPVAWLLTLQFLEPFLATRRLELGSCADAQSAARALVVLGLRGAQGFLAEGPLLPPPLPEVVVTERGPPAPSFVLIRLGGLGAAWSPAAVTPRFFLGVALRPGVFEVALTARVGVPAHFPGGPTAGAAVNVWPTLGGELSLAWAPSVGRFHFGVGANLLAEWWQLAGSGVSDPRAGSAGLLGLGPELRVSFELAPHFELGLGLAGRVHLRRPAAVFDGAAAVTAGPFGLEAGAAVAFLP